jgi:hypothetical protein
MYKKNLYAEKKKNLVYFNEDSGSDKSSDKGGNEYSDNNKNENDNENKDDDEDKVYSQDVH